jgi:hypothetical protein
MPDNRKRVRREAPRADYRALIHRDGEKPFDAKIVEVIVRETINPEGEVIEFTAEGCIFDNDGQLVPLSEIEGLVAILDPGEAIADVMQPKKQARRRRLMRAAKFALMAITTVRRAIP